MKSIFYYNTNFGKIGIVSEEDYITNLFFGENKNFDGLELYETFAIKKAYSELCEYFSKKRYNFSVPLKLYGTDFQKKVWKCLLDIPFGKTASYKDIAINIGKPKSFRAVGRAVGSNPVSVIVPCHRIIGSDGSMTGYAWGIDIKKALLKIEGVY